MTSVMTTTSALRLAQREESSIAVSRPNKQTHAFIDGHLLLPGWIPNDSRSADAHIRKRMIHDFSSPRLTVHSFKKTDTRMWARVLPLELSQVRCQFVAKPNRVG